MFASFFMINALASGGLVFAFQESTIPGKVILGALFLASIFSWTVMVTKLRVIQFAKRQTEGFLKHFRADRQPLRLYEGNARFEGAPLFNVYRAGCREMTFHLLGSAD